MTVLGKGAYGSVTGADDGLGGGTATKRIRFDRSYNREDFDNEVRILDMLKSHRNIVTYKQHGVINDGMGGWITMEWCREGSLATYMQKLRDAGPVSEAVLIEVLTQVSSAVQHMHHYGVMHRDIKPVNVFVCSDGSMKLGDFGVATYDACSRDVVGTRGFCSPEVGDGSTYGKETDMWSLGCLAYWLATGRLPFKAPSFECDQQVADDSDYDAADDIDWWAHKIPIVEYSARFVGLVDSLLQVPPGRRPTIDAFVRNLTCTQKPSIWRSLLCLAA